MRVLLVTNIITPYRQILYNALAEEGRRRGVHLHVAFMARGEANRNWRLEDYPLSFPHKFCWGVHIPLPHRPVAVHANPGIWWTMLAHRWDVIIIGGYDHVTSVVAGVLPKRGAVKLLWSESNIVSRRPRRRLGNAVKRQVLCRYDGYVVPGHRARDYLCTVRPTAAQQPFLLLPNVVSDRFKTVRAWSRESRLDLRRKWGLGERARILTYVGRLDENKGIHRVLDAISARLDVPLTVLVVGDGPLRHRVSGFEAAAGAVTVRCVGYQQEEAVLELLGLTDGLILPSLWDAWPLVLVEAASVGLPLICSDRVGNCCDMVVPGWNGWSFDTTSPESIRKAVGGFARADIVELRRMGARSGRLVDEKFMMEPVVSRFVEELIRVVESHTQPNASSD